MRPDTIPAMASNLSKRILATLEHEVRIGLFKRALPAHFIARHNHSATVEELDSDSSTRGDLPVPVDLNGSLALR